MHASDIIYLGVKVCRRYKIIGMASFKSTFSMMDIINVTKFCLRMMNLKAFYDLLIVAVIGIGCSASS